MSPLDRMRRLNREGVSYILCDVVTSTGKRFPSMSVLSLTNQWVEVEPEEDPPFYLNVDHIVQMTVVEL